MDSLVWLVGGGWRPLYSLSQAMFWRAIGFMEKMKGGGGRNMDSL